MNAIEQQILNKLGTLAILRRLPHAERQAILQAQVMASAEEDFETFEAYSEEDLGASP